MAQKVEQTVTLAKRILSTFATGQPIFTRTLLILCTFPIGLPQSFWSGHQCGVWESAESATACQATCGSTP